MGRGIALLAASLGRDVLVWGRSEASVAALRAHVLRWTAKKVERGELNAEASETIVSRIKDTTRLELLGGTEFVIESIAEDLALKRNLFGTLDGLCPAATVLATNTSSLLVRDIAGTMGHPERFIGTHFMNPPSSIPLVEVVPTEKTSKETLERALSLCRALGREPLVAPDSPGFVLNRILFRMIREAVKLLEADNVEARSIDATLKLGARHPMGPLELADFIGLDICSTIMGNLAVMLRDDGYSPPALLQEKVARGELGRKTGKGFYCYSR
jgi:3-hydroxybutyryl-CoA dehydrogenase